MKWSDIELLKNPLVRQEIERYKWIESEDKGRDIGWEMACEEWLVRHADAWRKAHSGRKGALKSFIF